jgi:hypothetical protein
MAEINDVFEVVTDISDYIGVDGGGFLGEGFLTELFKVLGEIAPAIAEAFGDALAEVSPELSDVMEQVVSTLLNVLSDALQDIEADFPAPFGEGPIDVLESVQSLGNFAKKLHVDILRDGSNTPVTAIDRLVERLELIGHSLQKLFEIVSGSNSAASCLLFGAVFDQFVKLIEDALNGTDPKQLITNLVKDIVFPKEVLLSIFRSAADRKFWSWIPMPRGLRGGELHSWINEPGQFKPFDAAKPWRLSLEREYRVRMVAALDAYVRQRLQTSVNDPISVADRRMSFESLSDVLGIFLETTIFFALEPDCFPMSEAEWGGFDDIGVRLGSIAAKQLKIPIRGIIGMLLRGISFWSINNDSLIEFLASLISTVISSIIEAVLRNLAWSLQIVGCYRNFPTNSPGVIYHWDSLESVEDTHAAGDYLQYVVLLRQPQQQIPGDPITDLSTFPALPKLAKDIGAYMDVCYQQYRLGSHFIEELPKDTVHIVRAECVSGRLTIVATTDATFELPQPILRAYFCCHKMPMRPGADSSDPYTIDLECRSLPRRATVVVLSNRGGVAERQITIVE